MNSKDSGYAQVHTPDRNGPTRCLLRIRFEAGAWHVSEDGTARIGGIFTSLSAAIAYARSELRGVPGGGVVHDFDGDEASSRSSTHPLGIFGGRDGSPLTAGW
jgi:hypothetical protein